MCRINAVILIFVCLRSLHAQGQISGIVLDKNTNSPIEYATIILKQGGKILEGTISNPDGSFLLPISGNGDFDIEISFLGYQKLETENVNVKKNTPLNLGVVTLETTQNFLNEVVVNSNRLPVQNKIDRQVYLAAEFSIAKGGTGMDIIRNLPSITVNSFGEITF